MRNRNWPFLSKLVLALLVLGMQFGVMYLRPIVTQRINFLELGTQTFSIALSAIVLNIASGAILVFLFLGPNKSTSDFSRSEILTTIALLGILPTLAVLIKLLLTASPSGITSLFRLFGPLRFQAAEWIIHSEVPSFWLGLLIGWIMRVLIPPR